MTVMVLAIKDGAVFFTEPDGATSHSLQAVVLTQKTSTNVAFWWWGSSQSAHSSHSGQERGSGTGHLGWLQSWTDWSSSAWLLRINHSPKLTSRVSIFSARWRLFMINPIHMTVPYLECSLLLAGSRSTPLAMEALLTCRPPSSLPPSVKTTRSSSPRGGSHLFRPLRSRPGCPSLPARLFFSFRTSGLALPSSSLAPQQWQLLRKWGMA